MFNIILFTDIHLYEYLRHLLSITATLVLTKNPQDDNAPSQKKRKESGLQTKRIKKTPPFL